MKDYDVESAATIVIIGDARPKNVSHYQIIKKIS